MIDHTNDPLARVLTDLARISPDEARAARTHARCAGLYEAARKGEPQPSRSATWAVGVLSVIYLVQLTRLAARLAF